MLSYSVASRLKPAIYVRCLHPVRFAGTSSPGGPPKNSYYPFTPLAPSFEGSFEGSVYTGCPLVKHFALPFFSITYNSQI